MRNRLLASIKSSPQHQKLFEGESGAIHPALGTAQDDIVVAKHRISAFRGSDLQMILRAREVDTLVLFGIATSGVVLSTLLEACDADYRTVVIADCCADTDAELHRVLIERLFPLRGEVATAAEFIKAVEGRGLNAQRASILDWSLHHPIDDDHVERRLLRFEFQA